MVNSTMSGAEIRKTFIEFFEKEKAHTYHHSSSVIPHDDPTLLFANAGMNQFKPIFQGIVDPSSDLAKLKRAVNTQKCIRAGGKHNDLDDVGKDVYHHTFFEMLGNWSFGDYFKKEICNWAWELLTKKFEIAPERLYISYFGGNKDSGLEPDLECKQIWLDIGVPESRILPFGMKDNFWEMGEVGPCGPCSEIHYDRVGGRDASSLVNADDPMVVEIWNLVFIQFNREQDGALKSLPQKHIDCGLGLERLVAVIQGKTSNYDTDIFQPIFRAIQTGTGVREYTGKVGSEDTDGIDMAYRVVADHARTLTISLSDGGRPESTGRGYVIRRILRRAVRYATEKLNAKAGFLSSLVPAVIESLGKVFPELNRDPETVIEIINDEEAQFLKTLNRGRVLFQKSLKGLKSGETKFPGEVAWRLYSTYGFPVDLTQLMAEEVGLEVDLEDYEKQKAEDVKRSAAGTEKVLETVDLNVHAIAELRNRGIKPTDDSPKYDYKDDGKRGLEAKYDFKLCTGRIMAIRKNSEFAESLEEGENGGIILDQTCFYAEQGGQEFDTGFLKKVGNENLDFKVNEVQVRGGYAIFVGTANDTLKVGDEVEQLFDEDRRWLIMKNHTGTHILNHALRKVLDTVDQKGSLVAPDRMRFDFTAKEGLKSEQVKSVEEICQSIVDAEKPVYAQECKLADAKEIEGLRAVFDETYPDPVRVVCVGVPVEDLILNPKSGKGFETSVEFCGGTHLKNVGHIGRFVITSEEPVAKGIRRIVAVTGPAAVTAVQRGNRYEQRVNELLKRVKANSDVFKTPKTYRELVNEANGVLDELNSSQMPKWQKEKIRDMAKEAQKTLDSYERNASKENANKVMAEVKEIAAKCNDEVLIHIFSPGANVKDLGLAIRQCKKQKAVFGVSVQESTQKFAVVARVDKQLVTSGFKALDWVNKVCEIAQGRGGGKDEQAQATCEKLEKLDEAMEAARQFAKLSISS
ncbi:Alanine--tRNA ligase, mitochondrial [Aphelenchoides besseyi]|nr:Alanine--tRNA ligase, mitochondrial [Aphelenchoides besseyi]